MNVNLNTIEKALLKHFLIREKSRFKRRRNKHMLSFKLIIIYSVLRKLDEDK